MFPKEEDTWKMGNIPLFPLKIPPVTAEIKRQITCELKYLILKSCEI